MKISVLNILGYSSNGKDKTINLSDSQVNNLKEIIKAYKEELCASNQDITECDELLALSKTKTICLNERQLYNLMQIIKTYKSELCAKHFKKECNKLLTLVKKSL
jgi:hypothetical protein